MGHQYLQDTESSYSLNFTEITSVDELIQLSHMFCRGDRRQTYIKREVNDFDLNQIRNNANERINRRQPSDVPHIFQIATPYGHVPLTDILDQQSPSAGSSTLSRDRASMDSTRGVTQRSVQSSPDDGGHTNYTAIDSYRAARAEPLRF